MSSTILLDKDLFTQKGMITLNVNRTFHLNITAIEAQRCVHHWLVDEVSSNIGADVPVLLLDERPVWRVPAWLSFPNYGQVGEVGIVDVDVETGQMLDLTRAKLEIERRAEGLVEHLPAYSLRRVTAKAIRPIGIPAAPKLVLQDDDLLAEAEMTKNEYA